MRDGRAKPADDGAGGLVGDAHGVGERRRPSVRQRRSCVAARYVVHLPRARWNRQRAVTVIPSTERVTSSASMQICRSRCAFREVARRATGRRLRATRRDWA
jgi:hypothetical protein